MSPKEQLQLVIDTTLMLKQHAKVKQFQVIGSSLIDGLDAKDVDFLVLADAPSFMCSPSEDFDFTAPASESLAARWLFGYEWDAVAGKYDDQDDKWGSLRRGDVNLIVTVDPDWYKRALLANEVCVSLQLKDKGDRIVVYRVVRDGYNAEQANARRDGSR